MHGDALRSDGLVITISPQHVRQPGIGTQGDIAKFFNGSTPNVGLSITLGDGKPLLHMTGWQMAVPNYKDGTSQLNYDRRPTDPPFLP
jgi:alpha-D-xyloside xylohydrolase